MSSDDDIIEPDMLSEDGLANEDFDGEEEEFDEEALDAEDVDAEYDEELDEEDNGVQNGRKGLVAGNKKKLAGRRSAIDEYDEELDEMNEGENAGAAGGDDEGEIMKSIQEGRITHQKFFGFLSSKGGDVEEDEYEDEGDESYIYKVEKQALDDVDNTKVKEVQKGRAEFIELVDGLKESVVEVKQKFLPILAKIKNRNLNISEGMNYLDSKFNIINLYCTNLAVYVLLKAQGRPLKDHPIIKRLIYIKTLVNKLKPLDKKLEYQVNKLLRMANEETLVGQSYSKKAMGADPLSLKPRPDTMSKTLTTDDVVLTDNGDISAEIMPAGGKYKAPKFSATLMAEDAKVVKKKRESDRLNKKLMKDTILREIDDEAEDRPLERKPDVDNPYLQEDEEEKRQRKFEEEFLTRIPLTKKQIKTRKEKEKRISKGEDFGEAVDEIQKSTRYLTQESRLKDKLREENEGKVQKTFADYLTKRRNERVQEGDDEGFGDDVGDEDGAEFYGARKKVKQERGQFQTKGKPKGGFSGSKGPAKPNKSFGAKKAGFGRGAKFQNKKRF